MRFSSFRHFLMLATILVTGISAMVSRAADPVFEQVLPAGNTTALLEHRSKVLRGLDGGGIIVWDRDDPSATERWTSGRDLSGNHITDMVWTGQYVWIATRGAGMTRVKNLDTAPEFRQYTNNIGSLDITVVTGTIIGTGERVFYGMSGQGLGQINSGLPGNIYTVGDGLISNEVISLQMFRNDLFVGTPVGISRFANNEFTDQNTGLSNLVINDLTLDDDGNLLAASNAGIHQWDPDAQAWFLLGTIGPRVVDITSSAGLVYALGLNPDGSAVLGEYDGSSWSPISLPYSQCSAIYAGEEFWIGGPRKWVTSGGKLTYNYLGRRLAGNDFDTTVDAATQVTNCQGVAFGADDTAWMGDGHGFQISRYDPGDNSFLFIFERPHAANDTLNLFPGLGPVLSIVGASDGTVYAGQYAGGGVLKFNPATRTTDLMDPDNSGLQGKTIVNLVAHPDGSLIILHDQWNDQKVEVLVDPGNWTETESWVLPPMDQGLDSGTSVWDAVVERPDIIWFAVEDGGLVCWDINGPDAGPNDPLTWTDQNDDLWYDPVTFYSGTSLDPGKTVSLAMGHDGTIWAGGNGLVQFSYEILAGNFIRATSLLDFKEKISSSSDGLVNGNVEDISVDSNGDIWVATATGLNRVSPRGEDALISAWIDLPNYLANPTYQVLYSPNVIAPMPGNNYAKIVSSGSGRQMLLSADQGTTLITVGSGSGTSGSDDPLKNVYAYPNPWIPGEPADQLKLGGLPDGTIGVEVYNVEGQLVFSDKSVAEGVGFWEGDNIRGRSVSSGMYVLRITAGKLTTTRILALVR